MPQYHADRTVKVNGTYHQKGETFELDAASAAPLVDAGALSLASDADQGAAQQPPLSQSDQAGPDQQLTPPVPNGFPIVPPTPQQPTAEQIARDIDSIE